MTWTHATSREGRVETTNILSVMADEVTACNEEKGWHDSNPKVVEFMERMKERFDGLLTSDEMQTCHEIAVEMFGQRTFGDDVALLHTEVSEMLEAFRDYGVDDATRPSYRIRAEGDPKFGQMQLEKPEGVGSEAADVLVRLLDTCSRYDIDLFAEWRRKMDFNWTRPTKHGGKRL